MTSSKLTIATGAMLGAICGATTIAEAATDSVRKALETFAPETRAHQACALKGLDVMRRAASPRHADQIKSSIFGAAKLTGTTLEAKGAAVRAAGHWYALTYSCTLADDLMKGLTFTYHLGREVPHQDWERRGLW